MKRTALKRKTPLRAKRPTPRRSSPTRKRSKSAAEKKHHDRIAAMPCIRCGRWPVHVHHVIFDGWGRITRNHRLVLPVCPDCHQDGPEAIHRIGSRAWNLLTGIDQHALAVALWEAENG